MKPIVLVLLLAGFAAAAAPVDFYVSTEGDDGQSGTFEAPFATVQRAQSAVRDRLAQGEDADITVYLRDGLYALEAPLHFTAADCGQQTVTYKAYQNETPILSGGRPITGWQPGDGGQWTATLPEALSGAWPFRQLFKDDTRLPRGRFPNGDALMRVAIVDDAVTGIKLHETLPVALTAEDNAELVVYQNWSITRVPIVSGEGASLRVSHPAGWIGHGSMTTTSPDKPCYVENAAAFVDAPGEWHLDKQTGTLIYQAAPGEDPNQARFIAPKLELLLKVEGKAGAPVKNLRFEGLTFSHAEWPLPEFGYIGVQAGHHGTSMNEPAHVLPGALQFTHAEGCVLARCAVVHTGASGVVLGAGCKNNRVEYCSLSDIGGNGVMVGWRGSSLAGAGTLVGDGSLSSDWASPDLVPMRNTVADCTVTSCGAVNRGCVGVFDAFCDGTRISHNHIFNMPYTGISIGFRWDSTETSQRNCTVENNHIHDVMKVLADGGAIYTLGLQPGTVLRGNLLYDVHRSSFAHGGAPNNGIFFDEGSKGFLVEDNIIHNTSGEPIRFNQTGPENLTFNNNAFGVAPEDPAFPKARAAEAGPRQQDETKS
ncbi:MAG: right-handed parallel beta-helix repeat-containing protein [Candidatus Hydrogenedentes bacterium]|nr:right-handed parallel beta-helix repeat-containing protein [Candidatus Hydrogenedentota bacterium]